MKNALFIGLLWLVSSVSVFGQTKDTHVMAPFDELEIGGTYEVFFRLGANHEVIVVADDDDHEDVRIDQNGRRVEIGSSSMWNTERSDIQIFITCRDLKELDVSGAVEFTSKNTIKNEFFRLDASGAAEIELVVETGLLTINSSGASEIVIRGEAQRLKMDMSGASELDARQLKAKELTAEMSGASSAQATATEQASVELSGASSLDLGGSPNLSYKEISGAASLNRR
jgi:hypothetical protein